MYVVLPLAGKPHMMCRLDIVHLLIFPDIVTVPAKDEPKALPEDSQSSIVPEIVIEPIEE